MHVLGQEWDVYNRKVDKNMTKACPLQQKSWPKIWQKLALHNRKVDKSMPSTTEKLTKIWQKHALYNRNVDTNMTKACFNSCMADQRLLVVRYDSCVAKTWYCRFMAANLDKRIWFTSWTMDHQSYQNCVQRHDQIYSFVASIEIGAVFMAVFITALVVHHRNDYRIFPNYTSWGRNIKRLGKYDLILQNVQFSY